jgi:IS30 family transposase
MLEMLNALKVDDCHMIKSMKEQGMSISEIARRTGPSRKTVRKYIAMDKPGRCSRKVRDCNHRLIFVHFRRNKSDPDRRFNRDPFSQAEGDHHCMGLSCGE